MRKTDLTTDTHTKVTETSEKGKNNKKTVSLTLKKLFVCVQVHQQPTFHQPPPAALLK